MAAVRVLALLLAIGLEVHGSKEEDSYKKLVTVSEKRQALKQDGTYQNSPYVYFKNFEVPKMTFSRVTTPKSLKKLMKYAYDTSGSIRVMGSGWSYNPLLYPDGGEAKKSHLVRLEGKFLELPDEVEDCTNAEFQDNPQQVWINGAIPLVQVAKHLQKKNCMIEAHVTGGNKHGSPTLAGICATNSVGSLTPTLADAITGIRMFTYENIAAAVAANGTDRVSFYKTFVHGDKEFGYACGTIGRLGIIDMVRIKLRPWRKLRSMTSEVHYGGSMLHVIGTYDGLKTDTQDPLIPTYTEGGENCRISSYARVRMKTFQNKVCAVKDDYKKKGCDSPKCGYGGLDPPVMTAQQDFMFKFMNNVPILNKYAKKMSKQAFTNFIESYYTHGDRTENYYVAQSWGAETTQARKVGKPLAAMVFIKLRDQDIVANMSSFKDICKRGGGLTMCYVRMVPARSLYSAASDTLPSEDYFTIDIYQLQEDVEGEYATWSQQLDDFLSALNQTGVLYWLNPGKYIPEDWSFEKHMKAVQNHRYEQDIPEFQQLVSTQDPRGVFRSPWFEFDRTDYGLDEIKYRFVNEGEYDPKATIKKLAEDPAGTLALIAADPASFVDGMSKAMSEDPVGTSGDVVKASVAVLDTGLQSQAESNPMGMIMMIIAAGCCCLCSCVIGYLIYKRVRKKHAVSKESEAGKIASDDTGSTPATDHITSGESDTSGALGGAAAGLVESSQQELDRLEKSKAEDDLAVDEWATNRLKMMEESKARQTRIAKDEETLKDLEAEIEVKKVIKEVKAKE